jgi:hypothetical protein
MNGDDKTRFSRATVSKGRTALSSAKGSGELKRNRAQTVFVNEGQDHRAPETRSKTDDQRTRGEMRSERNGQVRWMSSRLILRPSLGVVGVRMGGEERMKGMECK